MTIRGRDMITALPNSITVNSKEIEESLKDSVHKIVLATKSVLEETLPELSADIIEKGILMTGGGALLDGLNKLIEENTGVTVEIANNSVEAVAEGTGQVLNFIDKIDFDIFGKEISLID